MSVYRSSAKYQEFHPAYQGHWVTACASDPPWRRSRRLIQLARAN